MTPITIQGLEHIAKYIGKHCGDDPPCPAKLKRWITHRKFPAIKKDGDWWAWSDLIEHWTDRTLKARA
jgi:hypothetical protein